MPRRRRRYKWASECDLAAQVVAWLRREGWEVFQEIAGIDIVARRDDELWAIEAKRAWNLKVLAQAEANRKQAHRSSIAVPSSFMSSEERFGLKVASQFGLGVLLVKKPDAKGHSEVTERSNPVAGKPRGKSLQPWLNERAKDHAKAGQAAAPAWTPFKETCARLVDLIATEGSQPLADAVRSIEHHYTTDAKARDNLSRALKQPLAGLRIQRQEGRIILLADPATAS